MIQALDEESPQPFTWIAPRLIEFQDKIEKRDPSILQDLLSHDIIPNLSDVRQFINHLFSNKTSTSNKEAIWRYIENLLDLSKDAHILTTV